MAYVNESRRTFSAGEDLPAYRLTALAEGKAALHEGDAAEPLGVIEYPVAEGEPVSVRLLSGPGTTELETDEAVPVGALLYAKADGLVGLLPAAPGEYRRVGTALAAAPAGGGVREVLPFAYTQPETEAG